MSRLQPASRYRQQGAATLLLVLVLTTVTGIVTLTTTSVGVMEQRILGNEFRAREALEAAEAGAELAVGWANDNEIPWPSGGNTLACPGGADCPSLTDVVGTSSGESYGLSLVFSRANADADFIKVAVISSGNLDTSLTATVERHIRQYRKELFEINASMPPPLVMAGCLTSPTGNPDVYVLDSANTAIVTGSTADATCLTQGNMGSNTWADTNGNGYLDAADTLDSASFNRGSFSGCPAANCAWNEMFQMDLQDAKASATIAEHVYSSSIPCGPASTSPSIYLINNSGPINTSDISGSCSGAGVDSATIGGPEEPILLIISNSSGCPKFNGGISVYGIIYYEATGACAANGWGGATVHGSVIWEGDVDKPNANSEFIEVDYELLGDLNDVFKLPPDFSATVPGTWKDF